MRKTETRYSQVVAVKLSRDVANELRKRARADDRTLSSYLRRILADAVKGNHHEHDSASA